MSRYVETPYAALMLDEIEDYDELIEELTEFIDAGGQIGAALHNRSVAQWEIGLSHEALAGLDQATVALPTSPLPAKVKGTMLHKLGRLPEALAALDRAVGIAPEDVTILRTRAAIRAEAGMLIEAIADLDCAVRLQPEFKFSIAERDRLKGLLD
jgi:tetratricopeptide (TPR) repeat protein